MSKREDIASNIVTVLTAVTSPITLKKLLENLLMLMNYLNNNIQLVLYNQEMKQEQIKQ